MLYINKESSIPISTQLYNSFKKLILSNIMKQDEKLPSVRSIAKDLLINPNTVHKVYQELLEDNIVYSIPQKGLYVNKVPNEILNSYTLELKKDFTEIYKTLLELNISKEDILKLLK